MDVDKSVVFCTGDFDFFHIGHLRFLIKARQQGDYLVVCLNGDRSIKKGNSNRPIFDQSARKELLQSLKCVDEVIINEGNEIDLIGKYRPNFYAVGNSGLISNEILTKLKEIKCHVKMIEISQLPPDKIRNRNLEKVDWSNYTYIQQMKKKFSLEHFEKTLMEIKKLKVLVIGDAIIDEYYFTLPKGRAVKDPIMSVDYEYHERYAGGALAIANHVACYCDNVQLVTLLGDTKTNEHFIKKSLRQNISLKTFIKPNSPTTIKRRFINTNRTQKLFKVEYINDTPINEKLEQDICTYLENELPGYNLVLVGDFGHGFINDAIIKVLETSSFLAVNVQTNSTNMGYNYFTKYKKVSYMTMDEQEPRLTLHIRFAEIDEVASQINAKGYNNFLITMGKNGNLYFKNSIAKSPALAATVRDTIGAGDAVFSITSLFAYVNFDEELFSFIANCVGGVAVNIIGNKEPVTKESLIAFIKNVLE